MTAATRVRKARRSSRCTLCGHRILVGQLIVYRDGDWSHAKCLLPAAPNASVWCNATPSGDVVPRHQSAAMTEFICARCSRDLRLIAHKLDEETGLRWCLGCSPDDDDRS